MGGMPAFPGGASYDQRGVASRETYGLCIDRAGTTFSPCPDCRTRHALPPAGGLGILARPFATSPSGATVIREDATTTASVKRDGRRLTAHAAAPANPQASTVHLQGLGALLHTWRHWGSAHLDLADLSCTRCGTRRSALREKARGPSRACLRP